MRPLLIAMACLLGGCPTIPDVVFDNPCDPLNGARCAQDALVYKPDLGPRPDAAPAALADAGVAADAASAPSADVGPAPDVGPTPEPVCPESDFVNVFDCPEPLEGLCAYEFDVGEDRSTCGHFCDKLGRDCEAAWQVDGTHYCMPAAAVDCQTPAHELICGCR